MLVILRALACLQTEEQLAVSSRHRYAPGTRSCTLYTGTYEVKPGETKVLHLGQVTGMDPGDGFSDLKNGDWSQVWWGSYF